MQLDNKISKDLDIPLRMIHESLLVARKRVKKFKIPKKNGEYRYIYQPAKKLKTIQYWLISNVFKKMDIHESAVAYRDGISILHNAQRHSSKRFFLKIDLEKFFPSINYSDVLPLIEIWHQNEKPTWKLDDHAKEIIRLSCFFENDILPIGYPSSPIISNVAMFQFDISLTKLISDNSKYGNVTYTRYADDMVFSTDRKGASKLLLIAISKQIKSNKSPIIKLNKTKTRIGSSTGGSAIVTGLKICSNGKITIHRNQKDHIRLLLSLYTKKILNEEEYSSLIGHLAYVHYVDPAFHSKLQSKYFKEITELKALD